MSTRWTRMLLCVAVLTSFATMALAQGQGKGKSKQVAREDVRDSDDRDKGRGIQIVFGDRDRDIIREYYRGGSGLPPGLAKRGGKLPPGLEKQLQRNGKLPPGLQKKLTPFPSDLERRLPRLPDIYRRGTIGSSVVIIDRRTQKIMDVIADIIRPS